MASISASTHEAEVPDPPGEDYTSDYTSDSTSDSTSDPPSPLTNREAKCIERFLNNYERIFGAPATVGDSEEATTTNPNNVAPPEQLTCTQCRKVFKSTRTMRQHLGEVHIGTICQWPGCAANVSSEADLNKHLKAHNDASGSGDNRPLTCNWPGCGKVCTLAEGVARHLRRHTISAKNTAPV